MQHDQLAQGAHPFTSTNDVPKTKTIPIMYFINFSDSPNLQFEHAMPLPFRREEQTTVPRRQLSRPNDAAPATGPHNYASRGFPKIRVCPCAST
jgi:hypothetical protein